MERSYFEKKKVVDLHSIRRVKLLQSKYCRNIVIVEMLLYNNLNIEIQSKGIEIYSRCKSQTNCINHYFIHLNAFKTGTPKRVTGKQNAASDQGLHCLQIVQPLFFRNIYII